MVVNHLVHQGEMGVGLSVYTLFQRLEHLEYLESWEIRDRSGKVSESSGKRIGSGKMQGPTTFSRCFASHFRHLIDYGIAIIMLLEQL